MPDPLHPDHFNGPPEPRDPEEDDRREAALEDRWEREREDALPEELQAD